MKEYRKIIIISLVGLITGIFAAFAVLTVFYATHIYPNTQVAGINVSNLNKEEAIQKLEGGLTVPTTFLIQIDSEVEIVDLSQVDFQFKPDLTVEKLINNQRENNLLANSYNIVSSLFTANTEPIDVDLDQRLLKESVIIIAQSEIPAAVEPSAELIDGEIIINKGTPGRELNTDQLVDQISENLAHNMTELVVATRVVDPTLTEAQAMSFKKIAEGYIDSEIVLTADDYKHTITDDQIISLLSFTDQVDESRLKNFADKIDEDLSRPPQNPVFKLTNNRVEEFLPAKPGLVIVKDEFQSELKDSIISLPSATDKLATISVPVTVSSPDYSTQDVNDLGIETLLGRGDSHFAGSISSRMHNISLGSSKFQGVLVAPGEVFSFNNTIGDISTLTGYKQSYIIQDGATVLGDGGGVCQVSTTLFRAALDAGLPIVERRSHSYRVSYYEQDAKPGYDATVFSPTTDFKFKNDTPGHLLIQTEYNAYNATLVFEIYGTDDGRVVELTEPVITSSTPPPEDLYIDDPTLPVGEIKQIDYKAWGAKSQFNYKVTRGGEVLQDRVFYSVYQPWQAKFLRGSSPTS